jgi:tRNA pseudouridine55 synthase
VSPQLCGVLLLDKPVGLSSNSALQRVRRLLRADKAGHVGSLDPLATGMLPICLGEATKVAGEILSGRKRYRFTVQLGARTATGDTEGEIVETAAVPALDRALLEGCLQGFRGSQEQVPPMYSAIKRGGQPLYKLARSGLEVEREPRRIEIFELVPVALAADTLELEALCSKGTYIRTLAEDIARALGTCGHVTALRRLYVEPFDAEPMHTLEAVAEAVAPELAGALRILPPDWPLAHLPAVPLDASATVRILHGQTVDGGIVPGTVRLYDDAGRFLGIGEADGRGAVRPRRLFVQS